MTYHHFRILLMVLKKHWALAIINFVGYGIGLAVCLFIGQKISYELSYDKFNKNFDHIYRVSIDHFTNNVHQNSTATSFYPIGPELILRYPEVENMVRILNGEMENTTLIFDDKTFSVPNVFVIDSTFFDIFNLEIKYGTSENPQFQDIYLSESLSKIVFGSEDPTGEIIEIFTEFWKVKGVFKDIGSNSHFKVNLLMIDRDRPYRESFWGGNDH